MDCWNVYISTGDNHPFVAIMAFPDPPEADPFLMSKNSSKRKIRYRGLRLVEPTPRRGYAMFSYKSCIGIPPAAGLKGLNMMPILVVIKQRQ